jgi:leucine dehydrogenase
MRACLEAAGLKRARVAIQGVGHVGTALARLLKREGMELIVADTDAQRAARAAKEFGAEVVPPEQILTVECDVLAPCALGEVISTESAGRIRARIVCGSANNILTGPEAGDALARRGILFAPDYLVNAGGLIRGAEFHLLKRSDSSDSIRRIYDRTRRVLALARERGLSPARIADELAEARLQQGKS